ncbi:MAG TPA: alginate lyase family protein [Draconibacterium sp.]|nr:alginate lyase family protein [Draconibacterium sp.]
MKIKNLFILVALLISITTSSKNIDGIFVDFNKISKVKNLIQKGDENYIPAYKALIERADEALTEGPFSVMNKKRTPPSGDKHDYISMGPYWWPDPSKPDGLPYIRKDGEINPETRGEYIDTQEKNKLFGNVETLGWAYYFSGDKKYAQKALQLLETWFINPATRMNPNLNFAQGIPGRTEGRGIGIIDWSGINRLISPIQILEAGGILKGETKNQLYQWFTDYLDWLLTSKNGVDEDDYFNNHGTWYDVQVVGIELLLGKKEMAKARLEQVKTRRIATQIEPDGSQPKELARTKSLGYSTMNLRGYMHLAIMGNKNGVNLWDFETSDGRSIRKAYQFLLPYAQGKKTWTYQQLGSMEHAIETLKVDFLMAASKTGSAEYRQVAETMERPRTGLDILLYPLSDK